MAEISARASCQLFDELNCCSSGLNGDFTSDMALAKLDEEKMRCHVINCLAALKIVQIARRTSKDLADRKQELVKRKVFEGACSILINYEFDSDRTVIETTILVAFPCKRKISNGQSCWLPMHFAIALFAEKKISEDDIHVLYSTDPLAMRRLSSIENEEEGGFISAGGCTPAHLLCMQKQPDMSLVRYFCLRDPKAFLLCDQQGRCALHLVAMYSESVELLQSMLQIDHKMTKKKVADASLLRGEATALGFLCKRLQFPTFEDMFLSLIEVDRTVDVIYDGVYRCLEASRNSSYRDISSGSQGKRILDLLEILLSVNPDVATCNNSAIFRRACLNLSGDLCLAVLNSFLDKNGDGIKCLSEDGRLPIQHAASHSSVDVLKFLHKAYPESLSMVVPIHEHNLLHFALNDEVSDSATKIAKVRYLYDQCPHLMHMKTSFGHTPLIWALLQKNGRLDMEVLNFLCNADESVVRNKCTLVSHEKLPLHFLILHRSPLSSELSDEADCFRLFLRLYPASAGMKDSQSKSPYDIAVSKNLNTYFIRLLLSADPTIDPVKRNNLNFSARREGMFLAFRALSTDMKPSIWSKIRYEDTALLAHVMSYL